MRTPFDVSEGSEALATLTDRYLKKIHPPTEAEIERSLGAFVAQAGPPRRRRLRRWSLAVASLGLAALLVWQGGKILPPHRPQAGSPTLAYRIEGGRLLEGGYLRESGNAGVRVAFNEGSVFALEPGSRGKLRSADGDGVRLAIEHGTASLRVTPAKHRRWLVDAGPFLITVTGTAFTVSWDPLGEQFDLRMRHGHVVVAGPVSAGQIAVRAGQRLRVNLAKIETLISEDPPEAETPPPGDGAPAAPTIPGKDGLPRPPDPRAGRSEPSSASRASKGITDHGWRDALARGRWDQILDEAKRLGHETTLKHACSEDLFALANAARYRRKLELARDALQAERRRFPDSSHTLDTIYLLGRVEEAREHGTTRAIAWYDDYLRRAPNGPMVGEALGRKMTLTEKLGGAVQARPLAEEYLRRFPKGSYAAPARELMRAR